MEYDFTDDAIRNMVFLTHVPIEAGETFGGRNNRIICEKNGEDWPCSAILSLRKWRDEQQKEWLKGARDAF